MYRRTYSLTATPLLTVKAEGGTPVSTSRDKDDMQQKWLFARRFGARSISKVLPEFQVHYYIESIYMLINLIV